MAAPDLPTRAAAAIERRGSAVSLGSPPVIEGEDIVAYYQFRDRIAAAVKPKDFFEEIWVRDIADLSWEVLRLRRLKARYLTSQVAAQIGVYLKTACGASQTQKLLPEWEAGDPVVSARVDELLGTTGSPTVESITAHVFVARSEQVERIDRMTANAEARRNAALREIERRRSSLAQTLRRASYDVVNAEFVDVAPNQIGRKEVEFAGAK